MSGEQLDQIVKGASPPGRSPTIHSREPSPTPEPTVRTPTPPETKDDPLALLPSSPPQIYLNLLILEASLRSQYLRLRARRRQNTFFLFLLALWNAFFFYALFLQPREDGSGLGGSVYWVVDMAEKVALMGGIVTGILLWGTGQWERGVRRPRRFVGVTNRGLRTMNCKIVVIKGPWWKELLGYFSFLFPPPSAQPVPSSGFHYGDVTAEKRIHGHAKRHTHEDSALGHDEDMTPGGDYIKLLLLPKPFSPDFREGWELYRAEYWHKENERRAGLRRQLRELELQKAREKGVIYRWTRKFRKDPEADRAPSKATHEKDSRLAPSRKVIGHSRESSRTSTLGGSEADERPPSRGSRRGSATIGGDGKRRTRVSLAAAGQQHGKHGRSSVLAHQAV